MSCINLHTTPITFLPGTFVWDAAEELADHANATGLKQKAEFNGTPMEALPGDLGRHVHERWNCERRIYQLERGIR